MARLQTCADCRGHTFVVVTGLWEVHGEKQLSAPITMLCVGCGEPLLTATWHGDEDDAPEKPPGEPEA